MSQTKILSIIPESLHEDLFKEVAQVLAEKGKNNLSEVSPEIKTGAETIVSAWPNEIVLTPFPVTASPQGLNQKRRQVPQDRRSTLRTS